MLSGRLCGTVPIHARGRESQPGDTCAMENTEEERLTSPPRCLVAGFAQDAEDGRSLQKRQRETREGRDEVVGDSDAATCRMERSHRIWYNVIWNGNAYTQYHQSRAFLTITFLLRFGRAGKGDLAWRWQVAGGRLAPMRAGGRLTARACPRHPMSNAHPQKTRHPERFHATPHSAARHNHPLCCTS